MINNDRILGNATSAAMLVEISRVVEPLEARQVLLRLHIDNRRMREHLNLLNPRDVA